MVSAAGVYAREATEVLRPPFGTGLKPALPSCWCKWPPHAWKGFWKQLAIASQFICN